MNHEPSTPHSMRPPTPVLIITNTARFALGQIVATPGALSLLQTMGFSASALIGRHVHGDFGDCCADDRATNEFAVTRRLRLMSVYRLVDPVKLADTPRSKRCDLPTVWVITEADRSSTTLLLPAEY